ncbi:helix-turn-helix domain-containing protein [Paenibacillus sp. FSL R10-2782]|uniref:AraC family transcriptional regulator n=1 Tax=Paenibacillus sp. FSL R10-2782 TaxID=2954661 RepID=UPI0031583B9A
MNHQQLDEFLRSLDAVEQIQIRTGKNVNDLEHLGFHITESEIGHEVLRMQGKYFFDSGSIYMSKHHRFADMPSHNHDFIEMNYMYSGECTQVIDGREIRLEQGQICILDTNVPHSIYALGENDILVNLIMKMETFSTTFFGGFSNTGIVADFLANAVSRDRRHNRYILFHSQQHENVQYIFKNMLCEFLSPQDYAQQMLSHYVPLLLTELMRVYQLDMNFELDHKPGKASIIDILQYIEQHYRDCTLPQLGATFNFNPNYLGNLLKEQTGKTFRELVQTQRMQHADTLLRHTNHSISEIAYEVGYESLGFFYRKFKEYSGHTPSQYREYQGRVDDV